MQPNTKNAVIRNITNLNTKMRISIFLLMFLSAFTTSSFATSSSTKMGGNLETSERLKALMCSKHWFNADNKNHLFIFDDSGILEIIRLTEEDKISATKLLWNIELNHGSQKLTLRNADLITLKQYKIYHQAGVLIMDDQTSTESIVLRENIHPVSKAFETLSGLWRGKQLKKMCFKKDTYYQEDVRLDFTSNGTYTITTAYKGKEKKERGQYIFLNKTESIIFKPFSRVKKPYLIKLKHVTDNELVLSILESQNESPVQNLTLLK